MKKFLTLASVTTVLVLMGTGFAWAQEEDSDTIEVTATHVGIFTFTIADPSFNFGEVDADPATDSTTGVLASASGDGALYTAAAASTWTVVSAPRRDVDIYNDATGQSFTGPTGADEDILEIQLQVTSSSLGTGTSQGWLSFGTTGSGDGELVSDMVSGAGGNASEGNLDLRLFIDDEAPLGSYTWDVVLTVVSGL